MSTSDGSADHDAHQVARPLRSALLVKLEAALDRQMWLWGRDIRHPAGNPLPALGFDRRPPRSDAQRCSAYAATAGRSHLVLWSFGLLITEPDGPCIALRRHDVQPRLLARSEADPTGIATADDLTNRGRPATPADDAVLAAVLPAALGRFARYERAAVDRLGLTWRRRAQASWPRRASWPEPGDGAALWRQLAAAIAWSFSADTRQLAVPHAARAAESRPPPGKPAVRGFLAVESDKPPEGKDTSPPRVAGSRAGALEISP